MTDPTDRPDRSHRPEDEIEDRVRRTLVTVADRTPVTSQLDDLRHRIVDGPAAGDGSPVEVIGVRSSRRRVVGAVVAAAVLAVVVAGAVVATRDRAEERMATTLQHGGTGWYLPGAGTGWELVDVVGVPWAQRLSGRRDVGFSTPDNAAGMVVEEFQPPEGAGDPVAGLEPVERGSGDARRTYGVWRDGDGSLDLVTARRGDRVLGIQVRDVDADTVYRVVDGWWESDGERIDPVPGMVRTSDVSARGDKGRSGHTQVIVTVRRRADGALVSYALTPSGATLLPTGIDEDDRGASRGLEQDAQPRPIEGVPDQPGPAWEVGPDSSPGSTSVLSVAPGADIQIADDLSFAPPPTGAAPATEADPTQQVVRRRAHIELLSALQAADAEAWAATVADVGADPDLAAPTLADVPTGDIGPGTTTTVLAGTPDATAPSTATTSVPPTATRPTSDEGLDPEAAEVAEALIAFARNPSDETFDAMSLFDQTGLGVASGEGVGGGDVARDALRVPGAWQMGFGDASVSALVLIAMAGGVSLTEQDAALLDCGDPVPPSPGPHIVAIVPLDPASCAEDFAVLVNGDDGRISEVLVILPTA